MFKVSKSFLDKIYAGKRDVKGRVKVYWADPFFLKDSLRYAITSNDVLEGSLLQQVLDDSSLNERKWLHFDTSMTFEDEVYPAPSTINMAMAERGRVGWWSVSKSNAAGIFSPAITLTVTHTVPKTVFDILIVGDNAYSEFPLDFKVTLTSDGGTYVFDITGNQLSSWRGQVPESVKALAGTIGEFDFRAVTEMKLEVIKWSKANKVAKINTFTAVNEMIFEGDDLFNISLLEELEVSEGSLPIGTASANEVDIQFDNIKDRFYSGNSDTYLKNVLLQNRKIKPYLGVQLADQIYEWVPLGVFWSDGWNTTESEISISVTARDRMNLLRQMRYLGSQIQYNRNLYDLAAEVLEDARGKIPDLEYNIDEGLKRIVIPTCYLPADDYMNSLKTIVGACLGQVYADRMGVIQICEPSRFTDMKPWDLGGYVWVFDDGEEVIGQTCNKVFATSGYHKGVLYVTEETTDQVIANPFFVEVRDTDLEVPYRVDLTTLNGVSVANFEKINSSPLRYSLMFDQSGAQECIATVYSKSGRHYDTRTLSLEVRRVTETSLFALEGGTADLTINHKSPLEYELTWNTSGSKEIKTLIGDTEERKFNVEVRPEMLANWVIHKEENN